jgi:hypothetical protein
LPVVVSVIASVCAAVGILAGPGIYALYDALGR